MNPILRTTLILAACLAVAPSFAQGTKPPDKKAEAKVYFNAGAKAYDAQQFLAAIQAFEKANELSPHPAITFTLGQAFKRQFYLDKRPEHLRKAIQLYRTYLAEAPQGNRTADAAEALAELEPLEARLATSEEQPPPQLKPKTRIMVSSQTEGARISLDGGALQEMPLISEVKPGKHKVRVVAEGRFDEQRELQAAEGGVVALDIPLRDKPARLLLVAESGAEVSIDGRPVGLAPLATAVTVPAGSHLVSISRNGRQGHVEEVAVRRGENRTLRVELENTTQRYVSYAFMGAGLAGVVTGGVFTGLALGEEGNAKDIQERTDRDNIERSKLTEYNDAVKTRDDYRLGAGIAFGAGLLAGATGLVLYAFDTPSMQMPIRSEPGTDRTEPAPEPGFELTAGASGGAAGVTFRGLY